MVLKLKDPRRSRTYQRMRRDFLAGQPQPCWRCGEAVDYDGPPRAPLSPTVDHADEVDSHLHLALDPGNFQVAHLVCNSEHGARYRNAKHAEPAPQLVDPGPSRVW